MWTAEPVAAGWHNCRAPYSFYHDFIPLYWSASESEVAEAPIHRLCTLARKMGVSSFIVEDGSARPEVQCELAHLESALAKVEGTVSVPVVTFLRRKAGDLSSTADIRPDEVIGQAVFITFPTAGSPSSYVFEALVRVPCLANGALLLNSHVSLVRDHTLVVAGAGLLVRAAYFCQQNGVTSYCGHSAVRTLLQNRLGLHVDVAELNRLWKFRPGTSEVTIRDVARALKHHGLAPVLYDLTVPRPRTATDDDGVWALLAALVESASPVLLVIATAKQYDHVVPVLGHSLNTDEWHPHGAHNHLHGADHATSSSLWVDHLIINDDQLGPYYSLSRAGLFERQRQAHAVKPRAVITVLPPDLKVTPVAAEQLARESYPPLLQGIVRNWTHDSKWLTTLRTTQERRTFRTILIERGDYVASLRGLGPAVNGAGPHAVIEYFASILPERFWMCEVSLPNIMMGNRAKLGELLIAAASRADVIAARLPSVMAELAEGKLELFAFPVDGHTPIHAPERHPHCW